MSFVTILETLLIGPLKLLFEIIFVIANRFIGHPGLAIICLSLIMNVLVLPLYRRADAMQEESRDTEARLHDGVAHIKKTFSGDERMMILQAYYRQNNYKPTDALNGSASLLLEVPFFMAAYQFLSHLEILNGVSLGPIADLGAPDGLLVIGGIAINVLPILMTLVNVISSALYLKGFPLKTKIQLYGMALFFLVFLYTSPSCLVFYWTLNNVFSLVKTIFYKLKNPQKVLRILLSIAGVLFLALGFGLYETDSVKRKAFLVALGIVMELPMILPFVKARIHAKPASSEAKPNRKFFILGCLFLTVLVGLQIPSTFIAASPQEYVDLSYFYHPLWYIVSALCLSAGTFLVWLGVFYWLASTKGKVIFEKLVWALCGVMLVNYMFFGTDLGVISPKLQYEGGVSFTAGEQLINLLIVVIVAAVLWILASKKSRIAETVLLTAIIALGGMSVRNIGVIRKSVDQVVVQQSTTKPTLNLSKEGKNVVVIMLDRAMGEYVPYIFAEKPELEEKFDGFTYYDNVISYGRATNFGSPALLGGYEYTPVELNKRSEESLVSKQNEAIKVMPVAFFQEGFDVTVCDPVYANYQWIPDLSVFDDYPEIDAYISKGAFSEPAVMQATVSNNSRNFFCFSVMKSLPLFLQPTIYNNGQYNQSASLDAAVYTIQVQYGPSTAEGLNAAFMDSYNVLSSLPYITNVSEGENNTFLFMANDATHEPMMLQTPDYVPAQVVNNTEYDAAHTDRFTVNGKTLIVETAEQAIHYHSNLAALMQLGNWFDYLRENGVYDNTRIILVADHGAGFAQTEELIMDDGSDSLRNVSWYFPLLLVKDFDSTGFTTSSEFMTNADVPTLAMKDLIENPVNPFTGNPINDSEKYAHDQYVIMSWEWRTEYNNGNTFLPAMWGSVKDNLWDKENWTFTDEYLVLDEHAFP